MQKIILQSQITPISKKPTKTRAKSPLINIPIITVICQFNASVTLSKTNPGVSLRIKYAISEGIKPKKYFLNVMLLLAICQYH